MTDLESGLQEGGEVWKVPGIPMHEGPECSTCHGVEGRDCTCIESSDASRLPVNCHCPANIAAHRAEAKQDERRRIVARLHAYGIPDPVTDNKDTPCEHGTYSWDLCETCAVDQLVAWIERGEDEEQL